MLLRQPIALLATAALALSISACASFKVGRAELIASAVTTELSSAAATSIAADIVDQLGAELEPNGAPLALRSDGSAFGLALDKALRNAGYAVTENSRTSPATAIPLAYSVDPFDESVLVRISTPALEVTRVYTLEGEAAVPLSPVSILRRGETHPDE